MPFFVTARRNLAHAALLALGCCAAALSPGCTCGGSNDVAQSTPSASASATAAQGAVSIRLDDGPALSVPLSQISQRTPLQSLLGAEAPKRPEWRELVARGGKRYVQLEQLQRSYPEHELALYRDTEGRVCFGAFRTVRPDMPGWMKQKLAEPSPSLVGVESIELRTKERSEAAPKVTLEIVVAGKPAVTLDAQKLATLKETKPFRGEGGAQAKRGWLLHDVLGLSLDAREMADIGEVIVKSESGEQRVSDKELSSDDVFPLLKLNRRGELKLFVYRKEGAERELGAVRRIEVVSRGAAKAPPKQAGSAGVAPKGSAP